MAKTRKQKRPLGGPCLAAAFFCESTLEDKDGAISAIRIIDRITVTIDSAAPPDVPSKTKRIPVRIDGLVSFRTLGAQGDHKLRLVMNSASSETGDMLEKTLPLAKDPHGGSNLRLHNTIAVSKSGLFVIDVYLDGKLVTRMPIQIDVKRAEAKAGESPSKLADSSPAKA